MKPISIKLQFLQAVLADPDLSPQAKCVVAVLLLRHHNEKTGHCNPSLSKIAKGVGGSRRHIIRAVQELGDSGWLKIVSGGPPNNSNQYKFDLSRRLSSGDESDTTVVTDLVESGHESVTQTFIEPFSPLLAGEKGGRDDQKDDRIPHGRRAAFAAPPKEDPSCPFPAPINAEKNDEALERAFKNFWRQYPKREGEDGARRAFISLINAGNNPQEITAGAMRYAAGVEGKPAQFIAMPTGWLRDGRWRDAPVAGNGHDRDPVPRPRRSDNRKNDQMNRLAAMAAELKRQGH
jgi:hypothetical protein